MLCWHMQKNLLISITHRYEGKLFVGSISSLELMHFRNILTNVGRHVMMIYVEYFITHMNEKCHAYLFKVINSVFVTVL